MNLRNINEVIANIRLEAENEAKRTAARILEEVEGKIKKTEQNRLALMLLNGSGVEVGCYGDRFVHLTLGFFPRTTKGNATLAAKMSAIRHALGCRIEQAGKDVDDAKKRTVVFSMRPVEFPTVTISFVRKLPKEAKCKIVRCRSSYTNLVCEI